MGNRINLNVINSLTRSSVTTTEPVEKTSTPSPKTSIHPPDLPPHQPNGNQILPESLKPSRCVLASCSFPAPLQAKQMRSTHPPWCSRLCRQIELHTIWSETMADMSQAEGPRVCCTARVLPSHHDYYSYICRLSSIHRQQQQGYSCETEITKWKRKHYFKEIREKIWNLESIKTNWHL